MFIPFSKVMVFRKVKRFKGREIPANESCFISENSRCSAEDRPWLEVQIWVMGIMVQLSQEQGVCRLRREGTDSHEQLWEVPANIYRSSRVWGTKETMQNPPTQQKEIQERAESHQPKKQCRPRFRERTMASNTADKSSKKRTEKHLQAVTSKSGISLLIAGARQQIED